MPIGSDISLDLPIPGDTYADITAKLKAAIEVLQEVLEASIDSGSLDLTTALSLHGAPIINVGGLRLTGGQSSEIGTVYTDGSGELHTVTPSGDIQLTLNGDINVAALGTIGGDYGGGNPAAVTYDDASAEYRFVEDVNQWASLVAKEFIAKNNSGGGSVAFGVDSAITSAKTFKIKSLPASGVSGLAYVAADGTVVDANQTRETLTHKFTSIDLTGKIYQGEDSIEIALSDYKQPGASAAIVVDFNFGGSDNIAFTLPSGSNVAYFFIKHNLPVGKRIKSVKMTGNASAAATSTVLLKQLYDTTSVVATTQTGNYNTTGYRLLTVDTPAALVASEITIVKVISGSSDIDFTHATVVFDNVP